MNTSTSILLLGETGNGKSQLGSFLLGNSSAFYVSNDPDSVTKDVQEVWGLNHKLQIIDTPGFEDSFGNEQNNINKIVEYVRNKKINAIIILFNFHQANKLSLHIKEILIDIFRFFPQKDFFEHVGFVFSNSYSYYLKRNKKQKLKKYDFINNDVINLLEETKKEIPEIKISKDKKFPIFFINSNLEDIDEDSKEEGKRLIAWASSLNPFGNLNLNKIEAKIKRRVPEYRNIRMNSHFDKSIKYIKYSKQMRYKE